MSGGKVRIVHRCRYAIEGVVAQCSLVARLEPLSLPHQVVEHHQLVVRPLPLSRDRVLDAFENPCARLELAGELGTIDVTAVSVVRVTDPVGHPEALATDWRALAACTREAEAKEPALAALSAPSPRVPRIDAISRYARTSFAPGRALCEALGDLVARLAEDFAFDTTATSVDTPLAAFWERRRGVCQDFAHLTLACLRSLGLAARYVSGYAIPSRASHAWVALRLPSGGFYEVDSTSGRIGPAPRVVLAVGRDYEDVAPVEGLAAGAIETRLDTTITVDADA
jgi:transglutaminase-like putative cysteine protease